MILQGPPRPTLVRYGPCIEVTADSPEATAATRAEGGREEVEDRKEAVERILRESRGSRVPLEAILDALFPPLVWQEGGRIFAQATADRVDVLKTREDLDIQLLERRASETGVCPCRYDAVLQCFAAAAATAAAAAVAGALAGALAAAFAAAFAAALAGVLASGDEGRYYEYQKEWNNQD
ncbi:hypothetical protein ACSSS7_001387 [Eimeria intestinalis]